MNSYKISPGGQTKALFSGDGNNLSGSEMVTAPTNKGRKEKEVVSCLCE